MLDITAELRETEIGDLRRRIDKGLREADRGELAEGESFMESLMDGLDTREAG
jgi:predicted DNA-binding protein (UPF0278 family)